MTLEEEIQVNAEEGRLPVRDYFPVMALCYKCSQTLKNQFKCSWDVGGYFHNSCSNDL